MEGDNSLRNVMQAVGIPVTQEAALNVGLDRNPCVTKDVCIALVVATEDDTGMVTLSMSKEDFFALPVADLHEMYFKNALHALRDKTK